MKTALKKMKTAQNLGFETCLNRFGMGFIFGHFFIQQSLKFTVYLGWNGTADCEFT